MCPELSRQGDCSSAGGVILVDVRSHLIRLDYGTSGREINASIPLELVKWVFCPQSNLSPTTLPDIHRICPSCAPAGSPGCVRRIIRCLCSGLFQTSGHFSLCPASFAHSTWCCGAQWGTAHRTLFVLCESPCCPVRTLSSWELEPHPLERTAFIARKKAGQRTAGGGAVGRTRGGGGTQHRAQS